MIISHTHRYVFVEIPLTASFALRYELCEYYDGVPILHKHATYWEFRRTATEEERGYFAFATVRNPLDTLVSRYFKLKTDHHGVFSDPQSVSSLASDYSDREKYAFVRSDGVSFQDFFRRYQKRPYGDLIDVASSELDFVIRYERLQEGFSEVLQLLGLRQVRPVPVVNKTEGKGDDWRSYYTSDMISQAKRVCGPFMQKWGYDFPSEWGGHRSSRINQVEYQLVNWMRLFYLTHFRFSDRTYARLARVLRAYLLE